MDVPLAHYKLHRLKTNGTPSTISLNPGGDHLAVGYSNGDICIWKLPLDDDTTPTHRVCIKECSGAEVSSILWVSDTLVTFGRRNGLVAVVKLDYTQESLSAVNLEAGDPSQAIRCISYHGRLGHVATATTNTISIWEFDQRRWDLWKKVRTFPAHTAQALSKEEEKVVEITSVHWLKRHKGLKATLLVSFLHHGVRIINAENEQVVYHLPVRTHVGSLSLSDDETVVVINNTHNGFNMYSVPNGAILEHLNEPSLCGVPGSVFMGSDRFLVYPGNDGILKVWNVKSKVFVGSVCGEKSSQILSVEARSCKGYHGHYVLVTLAQGDLSPKSRHVNVWESLRKDELQAQQIQFEFSMTASLVVISAILATWYLASRSSNMP